MPGREEPGTGVIDYPHLFAQIDRMSTNEKYAGWVSAEYRSGVGRSTEETLGWLQEYEDSNPG